MEQSSGDVLECSAAGWPHVSDDFQLGSHGTRHPLYVFERVEESIHPIEQLKKPGEPPGILLFENAERFADGQCDFSEMDIQDACG